MRITIELVFSLCSAPDLAAVFYPRHRPPRALECLIPALLPDAEAGIAMGISLGDGATEGALLCGEGGFEPVLRRFWGRLCKTNWRSTLEPGL